MIGVFALTPFDLFHWMGKVNGIHAGVGEENNLGN